MIEGLWTIGRAPRSSRDYPTSSTPATSAKHDLVYIGIVRPRGSSRGVEQPEPSSPYRRPGTTLASPCVVPCLSQLCPPPPAEIAWCAHDDPPLAASVRQLSYIEPNALHVHHVIAQHTDALDRRLDPIARQAIAAPAPPGPEGRRPTPRGPPPR